MRADGCAVAGSSASRAAARSIALKVETISSFVAVQQYCDPAGPKTTPCCLVIAWEMNYTPDGAKAGDRRRGEVVPAPIAVSVTGFRSIAREREAGTQNEICRTKPISPG